MRYVVLCLVFGGCAAGFHANPTDQGLRFELGLYPTEAAGDFNATNEDAGTRRKYAEACDRAKEPAACLFALSVGANVNAARLAYSCGSRYCFGGGPRPFGGSARGMVPMGASYDVGAVTAAYHSVVASFDAGPDIVRLRPAYLALAPEPVGASAQPVGSSGRGGNGVSRSGDAGVTAPRADSLPRRPRAYAPAAPAQEVAACTDYQGTDWARYLEIREELTGREGALVRAEARRARGLFDEAERLLRRGLEACAASEKHLQVIRVHRANLAELRQNAGFADQEV